jgi:hypothetical protein
LPKLLNFSISIQSFTSKVTNNQEEQEGQNLDLISRILVVVIQSHQHHHPHHEYRDHHDVMLRNQKKIHIHHQEEVIEEKVRSVYSYNIILMIPPPKKKIFPVSKRIEIYSTPLAILFMSPAPSAWALRFIRVRTSHICFPEQFSLIYQNISISPFPLKASKADLY